MLKMKSKQQVTSQTPEVLGNISDSASELLQATSSLSNFDVQIHHVSDRLTEYTHAMRSASETNLAVVEETNARMSQVSDTVAEAADYLGNVTETAEALAEKNAESKTLLDEVETLKETVLQDSRGMSVDIEQLVKMAAEIDRIVDSVQGIAAQTNLLALNAAIEAARAGEHGKGFAVVAEEVRQLADDTKQNLEGMREFVEQIKNAAAKSRDSLEQSMHSIGNMGDKIELIHTTVAENVDLLQEVVGDVKRVNHAIHGINDATDEIGHAMEENSREAEQLIHIAHEIGQSADSNNVCANQVQKIDVQLSDVAKSLFDNVRRGGVIMNSQEFTKVIENAKSAHTEWLKKLKGIAANMELEPLQTDGERCAFGHFYGVITIKDAQMRQLWSQIGTEHRNFHALGRNVMDAIKAQNETKAKEECRKAEEISVRLMKMLDQAAALVKQTEQSGNSVF